MDDAAKRIQKLAEELAAENPTIASCLLFLVAMIHLGGKHFQRYADTCAKAATSTVEDAERDRKHWRLYE